jgi:hypothetical protein
MKHDLPLGSLDLPDDWEDRSTYQFVSPVKGPDIPMAVGIGAQVTKPHIGVLLSRISKPENMKIEEFLLRQIDELRRGLPTLRVISRDPWQHPGHGAVPTIDMTFELSPGQQVRQLQFYFQTPDLTACICLTVSSSAAHYESEKNQIKQIFNDFKPVSS